ncbi:MAG: hypothetical protein SO152_00045 [Ruminococcus sp.]|nr:hypothetical protein [Ruminococcus sp.]
MIFFLNKLPTSVMILSHTPVTLVLCQEKDDCVGSRLFQLYSPFGELYCFAVIFGFAK